LIDLRRWNWRWLVDVRWGHRPWWFIRLVARISRNKNRRIGIINPSGRRFSVRIVARCFVRRAANVSRSGSRHVLGARIGRRPGVASKRFRRAIRNVFIERIRIVFAALRFHLEVATPRRTAEFQCPTSNDFVIDRFPTACAFVNAKSAQAGFVICQSSNKVNR